MGKQAIEIGIIGCHVATNITRLRKAHRLSLRVLSEHLDQAGRQLSADALNKIEHGQRRVDVDDLVYLATVLQVEPQQLLSSPADLTIEVRVGPGGGADE